MHIEHFVPQSKNQELANDYKNCFYICGRCNTQRGTKNIQGPRDSVLLNPCDHAWGLHFRVAFDRFHLCQEEDKDAYYTRNAYQLNDSSKVSLRKVRRKVVGQCLDNLERCHRIHEALLDKGVETASEEDINLAQDLVELRRSAREDLYRYLATPLDHSASCSCGETCTLPKVLEEQTFALHI
jgi:hypothetical protein